MWEHHATDCVFSGRSVFIRKSLRKTEVFHDMTGRPPLLSKLHVNTGGAEMTVPIEVEQIQDA
jgi:hypothetical protein